METYLFVVNPEQYDASVVDEKGGNRWSSCKSTATGDRALVYVAGGDGITLEWSVVAPAEPDPKWRYMCRVRRLREFHPPIGIQEIRAVVPREVWAVPYTKPTWSSRP